MATEKEQLAKIGVAVGIISAIVGVLAWRYPVNAEDNNPSHNTAAETTKISTPATSSTDSNASPSTAPEKREWTLERQDLPLAFRDTTYRWTGGGGCGIQWVNFDADPSNGQALSGTTKGENLSQEVKDEIDLTWYTCGSSELAAETGASVGFIRSDENQEPKQCEAAASGATIGSGWEVTARNHKDIGFVPGAALCSITKNNRLARAVITRVNNQGSYPTVDLTVTTWTR